jgi:hypothetical protein
MGLDFNSTFPVYTCIKSPARNVQKSLPFFLVFLFVFLSLPFYVSILFRMEEVMGYHEIFLFSFFAVLGLELGPSP